MIAAPSQMELAITVEPTPVNEDITIEVMDASKMKKCIANFKHELQQLSYGATGAMLHWMKCIIKTDLEIYGAVAWHQNKPIGWCLIVPNTPNFCLPNLQMGDLVHKYYIGIYIHRDRRRKGIGRSLVKAIISNVPSVCFYGNSQGFYKTALKQFYPTMVFELSGLWYLCKIPRKIKLK